MKSVARRWITTLTLDHNSVGRVDCGQAPSDPELCNWNYHCFRYPNVQI